MFFIKFDKSDKSDKTSSFYTQIRIWICNFVNKIFYGLFKKK